MKIVWKVHEYLDNGRAKCATFSTYEKALKTANDCCDHSNHVEIIEWVYCHPLSVETIYPTKEPRIIYESDSMFA